MPEIETEFILRGPLWDFWRCWEREQLLEGPAGTGKTTAALLRVFRLCEDHNGIRVLMTRKARTDMTESVLKTWEEDVVPIGHPSLGGISRAYRRSYDFPNGSRVVIRGLDDVESTKSAEYDLIYCAEATQITVDDYEMLHRCLRSYRMPHQMIWMDANPAHPGHWINRRFNAPGMVRWLTRHRHNPRYWNGSDWTQEGRDYVQGTLANLTGVRRARLYEGKWVGSEGIVYDRWDRSVHCVASEVPLSRRVIGVDEGYTNPFALVVGCVDGDGRLHITREHYARQLDIDDKVQAVIAMGGREAEAVIVDPSAADLIARFRSVGIPALPANNEVFDGIMRVQARLTVAGDGKPRLTVDPGCANLINEFESYEWKENKAAGLTKDEPKKENDHALDALRYVVSYLDAGAPAGVVVGSPRVRVEGTGHPGMGAPQEVNSLPYGSPLRQPGRAVRPRY